MADEVIADDDDGPGDHNTVDGDARAEAERQATIARNLRKAREEREVARI